MEVCNSKALNEAQGAAHILGFACRLPESSSASDFWRNLSTGVDMQTEDDRRWPVGQLKTPPRSGKLPDYDRFDASFFAVHGQQANKMDPQLRKLLEVSYEALLHAGIIIGELPPERCGVYIGCCGSEVHAQWLADVDSVTGYEQTGCASSMFANRLSWFYNFKGPSKIVDTACSSSLVAMNDAVSDIRSGRIDYAIVGGASAILRPQTSLAFAKLNMLSPEGHCKSFDAAADGYARADGIVAIVLARPGVRPPRFARRPPRATVLACATNNDGRTKEGVTFPSGPAQRALAEAVCAQAGVLPSEVAYVEAHGTGTVVGDAQELAALEEFYALQGRRSPDNPLLIGSVKSNMGHCEGCSGLAGLLKVLLAFEHGMLPANLHFNEPNPNNKSLQDGTLKVVTEATPWEGGIVALSNFGFGGTNVHLLVEAQTSSPLPLDLAPLTPEGSDRACAASSDSQEGSESDLVLSKADAEEAAAGYEGIIPLAARTQQGFDSLVKAVQAAPGGPEAVAAPLRRYANTIGADASKLSVRGTLHKGAAKSASASSSNPAVWFAFSGNGSQWPKMGVDLLSESAAFRRGVTACATALKPYGLDLMAAFSQEDGFSDPIMAAVSLIAVQVGLTDMLAEEYGIVPTGMLGHSAGEIACGYADGGFTREQAVLVAYHRARQWPESGLSGGLMAATGLGAAAAADRLEREALTRCVVACDNSPTSTTLSGPKEDLQPLLEALKAEGVFVRELSTCDVSYHAPALDPVLPGLRSALEALLPNPKPRTERWVSAAFPAESEDPDAAMCSTAYQVHAFRQRVLFTEAAAQIPKNAIVLEIGPHSVLRSPLRQCRPELPYVATMKKSSEGAETVPTSVCELWRKGASLQWPVEPVPEDDTTAPELPAEVAGALVSWDHSGEYPLPSSWLASGSGGFSKTYKLGEEEHAFIADHNVDGRILMPATSYLVTAWEALAAQQGKKPAELPVLFEDVSIVQAVPVAPGGSVTLCVLLDASHRFQVTQGGDLIAEGKISVVHRKEESKAAAAAPVSDGDAQPGPPHPPDDPETGTQPVQVEWPHGALSTLDADAFYRQVLRTGIRYGPRFRMLLRKAIDGSAAVLRWDVCFIRLLDGLLQAGALNDAGGASLRVPTAIRRLEILDPAPPAPAGSEVGVEVDTLLGITRCAMAEVCGVELGVAPLRPPDFHTVERQVKFVPYGEQVNDDMERLQYHRHLEAYMVAKIRPHLLALQDSEAGLPSHLQKVLRMMDEDVPYQPPTTEEEEPFLAAPAHILARITRDLFADAETAHATLADPVAAIVQHPEHATLYSGDLTTRGFAPEVLLTMLDTFGENASPDGFRCAEVGAGTGGFTRQVIDELDRCPYSTLLKYVATDVSASWGASLTKAIKAPSLDFQVWDVNKPAPASLGGPFDLILASNAIHTCDNIAVGLANIVEQLCEGGFLLFFEFTRPVACFTWGLDARTWNFTDEREYGLWMRRERWHALLAAAGLVRVSEHRCPDESGCMFLYHKPARSAANTGADVVLRAPRLGASEPEMDAWLHSYADALDSVAGAGGPALPMGGPRDQPEPAEDAAAATEAPRRGGRLWLTGSLQSNAGLLGLVKCARGEPRGEALACVLDASTRYSLHAGARRGDADVGGDSDADLAPLLARAQALGLAYNVFVDGRHGAYRSIAMPAGKVEQLSATLDMPQGAHLEVQTYGDLGSMRWVQNPPLAGSAKGYVLCDVVYGALNFRDVMLAYGKLSRDLMSEGKSGGYIGLEFSGKVGECRVMGVGQQAIATRVATRAQLVWDVPPSWSLAQAATVPVAYCTAYYSLVMRGRLRRGQRVLIHSGSGAVGLASIALCLHRGCEVFTTCGSTEKRAFLLERFPALRDDHIGDSRSCSFEQMVLRGTRGAGVHLVLNSLAGDKLQASVRCLASYGALLEIGKYDILKGTGLSMRPMLRNIEFQGIDLDRVFNDGEALHQMEELRELLVDGLRSGEVQPLPYTTYASNDVPAAFRFMASGTHIGKVLVQTAAEERASGAALAFTPAVPQISFRPDRTYVVTGGLGGFGLALLQWLCEKGARSLVVTSKRGMRTGEQAAAVQRLRASYGAKVEVSTLDVADLDQAHALLQLASDQAPVGGIFHLAMILHDRFLTNQTGESWQKAVECKAKGALNLDQACEAAPDLEHFVMFSSMVAWCGNEGQANYGWGNMVCEMLCESRRRAGRPGLAVSWGAVAGVGYLEEVLKGKLVGRKFEINPPQPIDDCLLRLGQFLCGGSRLSPMMGCNSTVNELYSSKGGDGDKGLVATVLELMGLKEGEIGENDSLAEMGLDSLQLVEIRSKVQSAIGRPLPLEQIGGLTLAGLRELAEEAGEKRRPGSADAGSAQPSGEEGASQPQAGEQQSEEEPAACTRPSTPQPAEADNRISPGTPEKPGSPAPTGTLTPPLTPPQIPTGPPQAKKAAAAGAASAAPEASVSRREQVLPLPKGIPVPQAAAQTAAAAADDTQSRQREAKWAGMTFIGVLYIGAVLMSVGAPGFALAAGAATKLGIWAVVPIIPLVWMGIGFGLCIASVLTKRLIGPRMSPRHPIPVFSGTYARWWLVERMVGITTMVCADQLRATGMLVHWLRCLGAHIGENVVIDTLDVTDYDLISIGDAVAVGEGATIMGHYYKDGYLHFDEVVIGDKCRLDPYSMAGPGLTLQRGERLPALATKPRRDAPGRKPSRAAPQQQTPLMAEASIPIDSPPLSASWHAFLQVAGMYCIGLLTVPAAYAALFCIAQTTAGLGLQLPYAASPAMYAVAALTALVSPLFIPMLFLLVPAQADALWALLHPGTALVFVPLIPAAYVIFGIFLSATMCAAKWTILGRAKLGVHRRLSQYGLRFWFAQRAVEMGYKRFAIMCMGTWGINLYLRAMGAKIARDVNIRFGNLMLVPDALDISEGVHVGDTANIVTSMAVDGDHVLTGRVQIGQQVLLGLSSVVAPATQVGKGAVLAGMASAEAGADLAPQMLYLGSPAAAMFKSPVRLGNMDPPTTAAEKLRYAVAPFLLPLLAFFLVSQAAYAASVLAAAAAWLIGSPNRAMVLAPLVYIIFGAAQVVLIAATKAILVGRMQPGRQWKRNDLYHLRRSLMFIGQIPLGHTFIEAIRGSYWSNVTGRIWGMSIGRDVIVDSCAAHNDFDLPLIEDGVVVGRNAIVFCHLGSYRKDGQLVVHQEAARFGRNSILGARCVTLPGYTLPQDGSLAALQLGSSMQ